MSEQASAKAGFVAGLTGLQRLALALAALISIGGAAMWGFGAATAPDRPAAANQTGALSDGVAPQGFTDNATAGSPADGATDADDQTALEMYSPTVFRIGFAFFLGFAIAYALRTGIKIVLLVVGVVAILLIGLQMTGLITVHWDVMEGVYGKVTAWLGTQTESLTAFLRGYIPSGGSAVAGFGVGLLKKH